MNDINSSISNLLHPFPTIPCDRNNYNRLYSHGINHPTLQEIWVLLTQEMQKLSSKFQNFVNLFPKLHYKFAPLMIINHTLKKSTAGSSIVDDKKLHFSITTFTLPSLLYIHYITTHHANFFCKSYAYM